MLKTTKQGNGGGWRDEATPLQRGPPGGKVTHRDTRDRESVKPENKTLNDFYQSPIRNQNISCQQKGYTYG